MTGGGAARRVLPFALLAALLLAVAVPVPAAPPAHVVLVLGDSLSAGRGIDVSKGWVALLGKRLAQRAPGWRVVNASTSGDTTSDGLARIGAALAAHHPAVVVVELGGNDGLRGIALATTRSNLEGIIERVRAAGARVLLLGMRLPPNFGPAYNRRFAGMFRALAKRDGVAYVPFFLAGVGGVPALMQADGLHPKAAGQPRMLDNVWPALKPLLGSR